MKKLMMLVMAILTIGVLTGCGDKKPDKPLGTYCYYVGDTDYFVTFTDTGKVYTEYPDGTVEESYCTVSQKTGKVSLNFLGSRSDWTYDAEINELRDGSGNAKLYKTRDREYDKSDDQ